MLSWAGGTNEPLPSADGWWTGDVPLLFPPPIEWRPANFGEGMGDWGTCPMPSELLLLDRGSWIPVPGIELGPLLTDEAPLTEDAPLNWRRLFADDPRTTPDNVSISFLRGHGLWSFNGILHITFLMQYKISILVSLLLKYTIIYDHPYLYRFLRGVTGEPWLNCE